MKVEHQSLFKEGEVLQIQKRMLESARSLHAKSIQERDACRAIFGDDWLVHDEIADADLDGLADLDELLRKPHFELPANPRKKLPRKPDKHRTVAAGLFAGEPSYSPQNPSRPHPKHREIASLPDDQIIPGRLGFADSGANAKNSHSKRRDHTLSSPSRTGLVANFFLSHSGRVVAIKELHPDLDHDQIKNLLKIDAFVRKLVQEYQGTGELPDWAKSINPEIKQFFRLFRLCTRSDAKTITIRLDHETAEAALAAPRGPANYIAEIMKRTLAKLGIATDLAFNIEFNHTGRTENHPAHIHGALCIPDDRVDEVAEALRGLLALNYRQRYSNLAVHIEAPRSARSWAIYCIKEYDITANRLSGERFRKTRPDYATQKLAQQAQELYESMNAWMNS